MGKGFSSQERLGAKVRAVLTEGIGLCGLK